MAEKKKVAMIDHSFHKKTGSALFFVQFLRESFDVDIFYDEAWNGGGRVDLNSINRGDYIAIFSFQVMLAPSEYAQLNCKKIVIIPMYDSVESASRELFIRYRHYLFICFCKKLHDDICSLGIRSYYLQYFPPPLNIYSRPNRDAIKSFFWYRTDRVSLATIRKLIAGLQNSKLIIHNSPDPGVGLLQASEIPSGIDVEVSTWFSNKEDYLKRIAQCQLFFAPRLVEGIGFSFLEAMALGCCVVAPDRPTMNEYIIDGETGFLYDPLSPMSLDPEIEYWQIGENARRYITNGYDRYCRDSESVRGVIMDYVAGALPHSRMTSKAGMAIFVNWSNDCVSALRKTVKRIARFSYLHKQ